MQPENEERRPPVGETGEAADKQAGRPTVRIDDLRGTQHYRRRVSHLARGQLDELVEVARLADLAIVEIDYLAQGFTLGMPERRAAGLAILERERAA